MPLPDFNTRGDLPKGIHSVTIDEVIARFGHGSAQRERLAARLQEILRLATSTNALDRLIVFGSFVSKKQSPNDVDVLLVMHDEFATRTASAESAVLFDHQRAEEQLGASIFWIRKNMLLGESLESFISHWQQKRDGTHRGIVEVRP